MCEEKTVFITSMANYCYKVMLFVLKNAGTTYHKLMIRIFADHILTLMEVHIDDMLVKTTEDKNLLPNVKITFSCLCKHMMRLNPHKCTFTIEADLRFHAHTLKNRGERR